MNRNARIPEFDRVIAATVDFLYDCPGIVRILELPIVANSHIDKSVEPVIVERALLVGVAGWAAYTLYDAARDGNALFGENMSLSVANACADIMHFELSEIGLRPAHKLRITDIFTRMAEANFIEESGLEPSDILSNSAWKSMGAAIPLLCLLMKSGTSDRDIQACELYFYHLIMARQLSDDALDWKEDLERRKRTSATMLLQEMQMPSDQETMDRFCASMRSRVASEVLVRAEAARRHARAIACLQSAEFLDALAKPYAAMSRGILKCYTGFHGPGLR